MTKKELADLLESEARSYRIRALQAIENDRHMNDLSDHDLCKIRQNRKHYNQFVDALLVDFINYIMAGQGLDQGLKTQHLLQNAH